MDITTKFNVGDKLFTINPSTLKAIGIEVVNIDVFVRNGKLDIRYASAKGYPYESYKEEKCFKTREELEASIFGE